MNENHPISEHSIRLPSLRRLRFLRAGSGGPLVVGLAGVGLTADLYRRNLPALAEAGFTAVALDRPGFGGSSGPLGWGLDYYANRILGEFLDSQGAAQAAFIGNSLGGVEALHFYLAHPGRVSALTLVDPFGVAVHYPPNLNTALVGLPSSVLLLWGRSEGAYRQVAQRMFTNPAEITPLFQIGQGWRYWLRAPSRLVSVFSTAAWLGLPHQRRRWLADLREQYRRSPVPVLVVWGEDDPVLPARHAEPFVRSLPGAELVVYPGIRHHALAEIPAEFNQRVIRFYQAAGLEAKS